jgi:hypothetical protein
MVTSNDHKPNAGNSCASVQHAAFWCAACVRRTGTPCWYLRSVDHQNTLLPCPVWGRGRTYRHWTCFLLQTAAVTVRMWGEHRQTGCVLLTHSTRNSTRRFNDGHSQREHSTRPGIDSRQAGPGQHQTHQVSYPVGTGSSFSRIKEAGASSC